MNRSEYSANRQLAEGRKPHQFPKAARPTWGSNKAIAMPLWRAVFGHPSKEGKA